MAREYGEDKVLKSYLDTFEQVMRMNAAESTGLAPDQHHV
jgi:hypothetical protein